MAKKESSLVNMVFSLFVINIISAASLGFVYLITVEPIKEAKDVKQNFAVMAVLPEHDNSPASDTCKIKSYDGGEKLTCYHATKNGELTGFAVETWTMKGFSGLIRLMVGFDKEGKIFNISILEHKETPGLGTKMADNEFIEQYRGKNPGTSILKVKKDGGDIDAITAATISSRAFSDAVQRAYKSLEEAGKLE